MSKTIQAPGNLVDVNGHKMHVFCVGQGKHTYVFLSGHGTSCPTINFKPLWSILSSENVIAIVERAGYGWSEVTNTSRDLDTVLEETRKALKLSNIEGPFILVPHSLSGLEAIYWAQKYPNEVEAIIGLDSAIPKVYDNFKFPSASIIRAIGFLARIGIHRPFAKFIYKKSAVAHSECLTKADTEAGIEMLKNRTFTSDMINELSYVRQNANMVKNGTIPINTPVYLFISNRNEKAIPNWGKMLSDYVADFKNGKSLLLDCEHYVHAYEPIKIAEEIKAFILGIE